MATDNDLNAKMDTLICLTALQVLGDRTGTEAIILLGRAGLSNNVVADLVNTTPPSVRSVLSKARTRAAGTRKTRTSKSAHNGRG
jgi:hypothetical protein